MSVIRSKIIERVKAAKTDEELRDYLYRAARAFEPRVYDDASLTLDQCFEGLFHDDSGVHISLGEGFDKLNAYFALTSGLHVIAGPSGFGKTFWAMQWMRRAAQQGHRVLCLSLEMTPKQLAAREAARLSGLDLSRIAQKDLSDVQKRLISELPQQYDYLQNISIDTIGEREWNKILPRLTQQIHRLKPSLVVLDYVQMIHDSEARDSRKSQIYSDIARELKLFADSSGAAALLISQLNRESTEFLRNKKWDQLGYVPLTKDHIRESGGIAEAADSVQLVCVPQKIPNCPPELYGKFQVVVDKSRILGITGVSLFDFDTAQMRFI